MLAPPKKLLIAIYNTEKIIEVLHAAAARGSQLVVFPELAVTGYTCGDLFFQDALHRAVSKGLETLLNCSKEYPELTTVVGAPLRVGARMYNCAYVIENGDLRGIVPKTHIPGNEKRWFASGADVHFTVEPQELGLPEEMAEAVCYFAGDEAGYTTGQILTASGGFGLATPVYGDLAGKAFRR